MKKLSMYLLLVICLFVTGCGNDRVKETATLDEFEASSINKGFSVSDNMDSYSKVTYILDAKIATYQDIEMEMIKYSSVDYAKQVQENQIESFSLLKNTGAYAEKEKGSNYYKYALVSNGRYMISTRVDDTLIFSKVLLKDRELIEEIINGLGY